MPNSDDGDDDDRQVFMDAMSTQVSHVLENPDEFWRAHQITGNPATVFVAADGSTTTHLGAMGPQEFLAKVEALAAT